MCTHIRHWPGMHTELPTLPVLCPMHASFKAGQARGGPFRGIASGLPREGTHSRFSRKSTHLPQTLRSGDAGEVTEPWSIPSWKGSHAATSHQLSPREPCPHTPRGRGSTQWGHQQLSTRHSPPVTLSLHSCSWGPTCSSSVPIGNLRWRRDQGLLALVQSFPAIRPAHGTTGRSPCLKRKYFFPGWGSNSIQMHKAYFTNEVVRGIVQKFQLTTNLSSLHTHTAVLGEKVLQTSNIWETQANSIFRQPSVLQNCGVLLFGNLAFVTSLLGQKSAPAEASKAREITPELSLLCFSTAPDVQPEILITMAMRPRPGILRHTLQYLRAP